MVIMNMIHTEEVEVKTATGPGGTSGPLRVNLGRPMEYGGPQVEYSLEQAQGAFARGVQHHAQHGW